MALPRDSVRAGRFGAVLRVVTLPAHDTPTCIL